MFWWEESGFVWLLVFGVAGNLSKNLHIGWRTSRLVRACTLTFIGGSSSALTRSLARGSCLVGGTLNPRPKLSNARANSIYLLRTVPENFGTKVFRGTFQFVVPVSNSLARSLSFKHASPPSLVSHVSLFYDGQFVGNSLFSSGTRYKYTRLFFLNRVRWSLQFHIQKSVDPRI